MKFYDFQTLRERCNCAELAASFFGCVVRNGRTAALWRGGKNPNSVAIDAKQFFDHGAPAGTIDGGDCLKLAMLKFGDLQVAQEKLGEMLGLTPKMVTGPQPEHGTRYDELIQEGYAETRRDIYTAADGTPVFYEVRMDHPNPTAHKKQYLLGRAEDPKPCGLKDTPRVLFNLPGVIASDWCCIVEGPKCASVLIERGIPATTCANGAKGWRPEYNDVLIGKDVVILSDNDTVGIERSKTLAAELHGKVKSVRIVATSTAPKGDVADYILKEGHTADDVLTLIADAPPYAPPGELSAAVHDSGPTPDMLARAKTANQVPFRNYIPEETVTTRRGKEVKEIVKEPRNHQAMADDLMTRFLGFPRSCGGELFDHDRDTGAVINIERPYQLMAWIARRSKHNPEFARGDSLAKEAEFMESVRVTTRRYESISDTPDYPRREDVYYTHGKIPDACPNHSRLEKLVDHFCPASPCDRVLIKALFCQPLWYIRGIPRPGWIIDAKDAQGCGKTTLAELVARLYNSAPIVTSKQEMEHRRDILTKRCLSTPGRKSRIMILDNVTGDFKSDDLADWMTQQDITGMAPYGHGEECRPNNFTFILTSNTATVSHDIADRCFYIFLAKPEISDAKRVDWKWDIMQFIDRYRLEIVADIIHMIENHTPFVVVPKTRHAPFERTILQPCAGDEEMYLAVLEHVKNAGEESDTEHDLARTIIDVFEHNIAKVVGSDISRPVFIRTEVANSWGRHAFNDVDFDYKGKPITEIRNMAKRGLIPMIEKETKRWPRTSAKIRPSGLAWNFTDTTESALVISKDAEGKESVQQVE
jgi:hypothetical protein